MNIILAAIEPLLADAWKQFCGNLDDVSIHFGSILDLNVDAIVSPANSFGFMDGGIDLLYSQHFGWKVQERPQTLIRQRHHGELLVGAAEIVDTDHWRIPFVIAAPTMRVPMILRDSVNPYLATRAVLLLIKHEVFRSGPLEGEPIASAVQSVAFPGLGTGVGQIDPQTCARQVRAAIDEVLLGQQTFPTSWTHAQARHQQLYADRIYDLQQEQKASEVSMS